MIQFKEITLEDKQIIDACFKTNTYRTCDFSFANLYAWNNKFKTKYTIINNTLFLRFIALDNIYYYTMPVGEMTVCQAYKYIEEDAKENNIPIKLKGISPRMWENIKGCMPGKFERLSDRNNDEYLYLSEKLISLSGKKLQSKRNHINRFKAENPDWQYVSLSSNKELIAGCLEMLAEWEMQNGITTDYLLRYDYIATKKMLENFDYLELRGGAIIAGNRIVAFSIGEPLTQDTFVVHVEKAFGEINGAYTIINQQFVLHEAADFMYVNREEDMGMENLRKAKMSYYPDIMLEEGILIPIKE